MTIRNAAPPDLTVVDEVRIRAAVSALTTLQSANLTDRPLTFAEYAQAADALSDALEVVDDRRHALHLERDTTARPAYRKDA